MMLSQQDNIFDLFPGCFLSSMWFISWGSPQNSPFHALSPQLLAFPKVFGGDFPSLLHIAQRLWNILHP